MNQGKSMLIDKTSILSQNLGHYQKTSYRLRKSIFLKIGNFMQYSG